MLYPWHSITHIPKSNSCTNYKPHTMGGQMKKKNALNYYENLTENCI